MTGRQEGDGGELHVGRKGAQGDEEVQGWNRTQQDSSGGKGLPYKTLCVVSNV